MIVYLDASILLTLLAPDAHWPRLQPWLAAGPVLRASPWTITEVSSALSHQIRLGRLGEADRLKIESALDAWLDRNPGALLPVTGEDFALSRRLIRRRPLLRAADALHLAVALREGLTIATLDTRLADAAMAEGLAVAP